MKPLFELFDKLSETANSSDCFNQYMNYIKQFGLTNGMLMSISPSGATGGYKEISYQSTYDPRFMSEYIALGGVKNDISGQLLLNGPQNRLCFNQAENDSHSLDFLNRQLTKEELAIEALSSDFGIREGFGTLLNSTAGFVTQGAGVYAVGMSEQEYIRDVLPFETEIRQANRLLALSLNRFNSDQCYQASPALTTRQHDILRWLADGLRLQEIAKSKVYRSIHTVNKDLHALKAKFDAATHEELVAKGMFLGLID